MTNKDNIIEYEFSSLETIGESLKFMRNITDRSIGDTPWAIEQTVLHLTEEAILMLNEAMKRLAEKFPGNEFEPIRLD